MPLFVRLVKSNCRSILIQPQLLQHLPHLQHLHSFGFVADNAYKPVVAFYICHSKTACFSSEGADWSCRSQTIRKRVRLELFKSGL